VRDGLYLNSAYIAPVPFPWPSAARAFADRKASKPIPLDEMLKKTDEVRGQFARLIGAEPDEIGFLFATSEGENIVASALDLKAGDNVVVDELHYETTFVLYRHLEENAKDRAADREASRRPRHERGFRACRRRPDPARVGRLGLASERFPARHAAARGPGARPRRAVLHRCGAGARHVSRRRSCGGRRLHDERDLQVAAGRIRRRAVLRAPRLLERIRVDRLGALHVEKELGDHRYAIYRTARKFEYATLPFAEVYQLGAALAYLERVGVDRIERHTVALARDLREGLAPWVFACSRRRTTARRSSACTWTETRPRAREVLTSNGVQVSFREKGSQIRVSPALFNTREEIRRFLDLAKSFA
jgi:cysteine desulfurase/selenocysteine lyase